MPITELRIEGLRTIEKLRLTLDGLTVLIGDNGTGKSSILEACEILRRATGPRFLDEFYGIHGGLTGLVRQGAERLVLGVTVRPVRGEYDPKGVGTEVEEVYDRIDYSLSLVPGGGFADIEESVKVFAANAKNGSKTAKVKRRSGSGIESLRRNGVRVQDKATGKQVRIEQNVSLISTTGGIGSWSDSSHIELECVAWYLRNILVHLPFEVIPAWAARAMDRKYELRTPSLLTPAPRLDKLGLNLASCYQALNNNFGRTHWSQTVTYIRLGLGERIEDVVTWVDPGGGNIGLSLKFDDMERAIPSSQLSDGMLSYLAFIALFRLQTTKPSLVAFDEPEAYLHPHLLMRVLDIFEAMAWDHPVLLATHSDYLLDGLRDSAKTVVLCELDERRATRLVRPDRKALASWMERYRGLGDIRSAGHQRSVLTKTEST